MTSQCRLLVAVASLGLAFAASVGVASAADLPPRVIERLDRGVVAIKDKPGQTFVSWRLLGTEAANTAFDVFRSADGGSPVKLNTAPLTGPTFFIDTTADATKSNSYTVKVAGGDSDSAGNEKPSPMALIPANDDPKPYHALKLKTVEGYIPNDASTADLDGDGQLEIILMLTGRARDNSQPGPTDPPIIQAYKLDGTLMWQINLGKNIRAGAHYTQFMVYDFDSDGRAEMICKTSDGTVDGQGKIIGDANAVYLNNNFHVLKGPEFLTVFDGRTGAAIDTINYNPPRTPVNPLDPDPAELRSQWGDAGGNRGERYLAAVAYLDGVHPSAVMCRGYYTRTALWAVDYRNGKLAERWLFDTGNAKDSPYAGQGNHNLSVADVDGDGKDDIIYGGMAVSSEGKGLWSTEYGHGDAIHIGDLDPSNPGLEMFRIQERWDDAGAHMIDLKTGKTLWKKPSVSKPVGGKNQGPGRGLAADIDPRTPGAECWALGAGVDALWDAKGNVINPEVPKMVMGLGQTTYGIDAPTSQPNRLAATCNFRIYWDGDKLDELLDRNQIAKWDWEKGETRPLLVAEDCVSNNGTKATPTLSADIFGDWREELILANREGTELRIFSTTIPTEYRCYTLMHDPIYRLSIAWQNVAYNQPPHVSWDFYGTATPPKPNITYPTGNLR